MPNSRPLKTRMTLQRRIILEELRRTDAHPTAEELYEAVRRRLPRISLGTVYRNLEHLANTGDARKIETGGASRRFDGNVADDHYHARCLACGKLEDVSLTVVRNLDYGTDGVNGFRIVGHQLMFTGYCPDCSERGLPAD